MPSDFKNLIAWQKAMDLVDEVYQLTEPFPRDELYGLTAQLRRAAVSVPSNIAEGQSRYCKPDFRHFLRQARGSLAELQTQVLIAVRRKYVAEPRADQVEAHIEEVTRILNGLIRSTESPQPSASRSA